jgi:hypothetical protein
LSYTDITLIKRPPIYPLALSKGIDTGVFNNFIRDDAFQFAYRYHYRDYQASAISSYSALAAANIVNNNRPIDNETFNYIAVSIPYTEKIEPEIQWVDFIVRFGNSGESVIFRRFNKADPADSDAINAHNEGTTPLGYHFYNDGSYLGLSDIEAANSFDLVPLKAKTLEIAKNRCFPANVLSGYDTPATTSLALTLQAGGSGDVAATWWSFPLIYGADNNQTIWYYAVQRGDDSSLSSMAAAVGWWYGLRTLLR